MKSWLKQSGAVGLDGLELADFPATGRGVRTRKLFKQGQNILTIPCRTLWTVEHAHADAILGPALRSASPPLSVDDTLAIYILFVRSHDSGYDGLRSHVAALPASYSSSIFFTEDQLKVCAGTSLYTATRQLQQRVEDDYRDLVVRVLGPYPDLFPLDRFTVKDTTKPGIRYVRLILRWHQLVRLLWSVLCQVFINYGPSPNNRLLRLYGFVVPGNPYDSYDLVLTTHPIAPFFEQKQKLWALSGLGSTSTITLTLADPLPKDVLRYLRIQRLDETDVAVLALQQANATATKISHSNEVQVLRFLVESIGGLLESFGARLEKLEEQLAEGVYSPGGNAWAAAHVSVGEQRVLRMARRRAEDLLAAMESGSGNGRGSLSAQGRCANCQEVSAQLMLCGRCKSVMYCGRTCQVAQHKEHKPVVRSRSRKPLGRPRGTAVETRAKDELKE
ncbi:hypothetical protein UVI_02053230 [Ustilaginoidea virens]|uniref:MYND-type domain-containing protein n=1 Tax=Ustilaginoidea virens TaxID=1159556 RepID=A0A1B5L9D7_USTVR|nr:hypothetical protein UVI_02053230 [Ustilaginoidea virens]